MTPPLESLLDQLSKLSDSTLNQVPRSSPDDVGKFLALMGNQGIAQIASKTGWGETHDSNAFFRACIDRLLSEREPSYVDWDDVAAAQDLFTRYAPEISSALLLAALPQTYATERGAKVLVGTGGLTVDLTRRIRGTAQFLMLIMLATSADGDVTSYASDNRFLPTDQARKAVEAAWTRDDNRGVRWRVCATLRVHHEAIRRLSSADPVPLNQEDLLGALLTFSITTLEVLEQFGISWTPTEQLAYLRAWNLIGMNLGITGLPQPLPATPFASSLAEGLPQTVAEARQLLAEIRSRNWKPLKSYQTLRKLLEETDAGVQLISALLAELTSALQGPLQPLPEIVIRQLAEPVVRDRLGLGDGGLAATLLEAAAMRRSVADRLTFPVANRLQSVWLRQAANAVARAATVYFVRNSSPPAIRPADAVSVPDKSQSASQSPEFVIPGLVEWLDPLRTTKPARYATTTSPRFNLAELLRDTR